MTTPDDKLDFKKLLPIFVIILVDLLGLTIIIPLMPLYATTYGGDAWTIGLLGATYPIAQFVGAPVLGRLSDRFGRRPVLLVSQIGTLIGFLLLGFANALWLLFLSRLIDGLSGANISTAQAVITDNTTEKTRTQGLGLLGAAFGLGFVIGPIIAAVSLWAGADNYHIPAFIAAAFSLASLVLTFFWLPESLPAERRGAKASGSAFSLVRLVEALRHPQVGLLLVLIFAQQVAFGGFEQLFSLFTLNRLGLNASGNAVLFVFIGVLVVAVQGYFIGQWSRRFGDRRLVFAGLLALAIGLSLSALTPAQPAPWYDRAALAAELSGQGAGHTNTAVTGNVPVVLPEDGDSGWLGLAWLMVALVPASIGGGILQPAINSLITKRIEPDEVGGTLGISAALVSGANAIAPLFGGALFQALGSTAPFLTGGFILAVLLLFAWRMVQPGREETVGVGLARGGGAH